MKTLFILPIRFYQLFISPLFPPQCSYTPTCSNYMLRAIEIWGPGKGIAMGLKRIGRCHPLGGHGYDPVPEKSIK
jgi:uncharacterized protein